MKLKFIIAGLLISGAAQAEWVHYSTSVSGKTYYNNNTINKQPTGISVWQMQNRYFKEPKLNFTSTKAIIEFDCAGRYRYWNGVFYAGPMGDGEVVHSHNDMSTWSLVVPETTADTLQGILCGKNV